MKKENFLAFSLAELLISLLVISIAMAAAMPVITRKTSATTDKIWQWVEGNNSTWFGQGQGQRVLIGSSQIPPGGGRTLS